MNWLAEIPLGVAYSRPSTRVANGRAPLEHVVVQHFVQQDGEIEDREALHERERNPDERVLEPDEPPGRQPQDRKLPDRHDEVTDRRLAMERAQHVARDRLAELSLQRHRMLRVVVGHFCAILAGPGLGIRGSGFEASGYRLVDAVTSGHP